jgi:cytoskeletal protein RodZ
MDNNAPKHRGGGNEPEIRIFDPFADLRRTINERIDAFRDEAHKADKALADNVEQLQEDLKKALKRQENTTNFVIIVMVVGFLVLLFALASVLITSWQATQSIRDSVQTQQNTSNAQQIPSNSTLPKLSVKTSP